MHDSTDVVFQVLRASYVVKSATPLGAYHQALLEVARGGLAVSPSIAGKVLAYFMPMPTQQPDLLSERERQVLQGLGDGLQPGLPVGPDGGGPGAHAAQTQAATAGWLAGGLVLGGQALAQGGLDGALGDQPAQHLPAGPVAARTSSTQVSGRRYRFQTRTGRLAMAAPFARAGPPLAKQVKGLVGQQQQH